jgi:uncharacterized protein YnzC (UPF0291/DUF896 family)
MTTGLDDFQRRILEIEEYGAKRKEQKIVEMLLKEREVLREIWPGRPEYIQGLERAIYLIGGEKAID